MALREAAALGADEAVLLNVRGRLACAAAANLVFQIHGRIVTPPLSEGVLPGVTRARLRAALKDLEERPLTQREAAAADGVVLTNALRGLRPALSWDGRDLPGGESLKSRLEEGLSLAEDRASVE